jgi:hypothetical protein
MTIYHIHINSTGEDFYYTTLKGVTDNHRTITPSYSGLKEKLKAGEYNSKSCTIKKGALSRAIRLKAKKTD